MQIYTPCGKIINGKATKPYSTCFVRALWGTQVTLNLCHTTQPDISVKKNLRIGLFLVTCCILIIYLMLAPISGDLLPFIKVLIYLINF